MPKLDEVPKDLGADIAEQMDKKTSDVAEHLAKKEGLNATEIKKDLSEQIIEPANRKRMWRIVAVVAVIAVIAWVLYH